MKDAVLFFSFIILLSSCKDTVIQRQDISLNGTWQIAKTDSMTDIPVQFNSRIIVPGLVDMAMPVINDKNNAYNNSVYWYKRHFSLDDITVPVVQLKINKSAYQTRVFVNSKLVGQNARSFTPSLFDLKPFLNKESKENELVIAVGCRNNLPD